MTEPSATSDTQQRQRPEVGEPGDQADAVSTAESADVDGDEGGRRASLWADAWRDLRRNPVFLISAGLILVMVTMAAFPQLFTGANAYRQDCDLSKSRNGPAPGHPFGFDVQGCDFYTNVIYGARPSIIIGVLVTVLALAIAVVLGTASGYYGGIVDAMIARITDVVFGLPLLLGATVVLVASPTRSVWKVCFVLAALWWTTMTRLMRSSVLATRNMDYVAAAKGLGASDLRVMVKHILPNAIPPVFVYATLNVGIVISAGATLTFLGVGLQSPSVSWGLQLNDARDFFLDSPHLLLFPALFLSVTVLSFILLGDAVRDAFDPKLR